jgi:ribosomal protein L4
MHESVKSQLANTISTEVAGRLIMVGAERVRQLSKQGWIKKAGRNLYRVADVVQGYASFLKDEQARRASGNGIVQTERAREITLRNRRVEGVLVPAAEVINFVELIVAQALERVATLPEQERDPEQRARLKGAIHGIGAEVTRLIDDARAEWRQAN